MNRQERRKEIAPFILHSKSFKKAIETVLDDGSISFNVEGYASTVEKDGSGDIVVPTGIDVSRYMKNPILKMGHTRGEEYNVGLVDNITIDDYGMFIKGNVVLNPTIEKHKEWIHGLRHNLINGFSIGFGDVVQHFDAERDANIIDSMTLYEISLVDIPDNPMTIRKAINLYAQKSEKNIEQITEERVKEFEAVRDEVFKSFNEHTNMGYKELLKYHSTECSKTVGIDRSPAERSLRLKEKAKINRIEKDVTDAGIVIASISSLKSKMGEKGLLVDSQGNTCGTKPYVKLKNMGYDHAKPGTVKSFNTKNTKMLLNAQQIQVGMIVEYKFDHEYCYCDDTIVGIITNVLTAGSVVCWGEGVQASIEDPVVVINRVVVGQVELIPTSIYDTVKFSDMEVYTTDMTGKDISKVQVKVLETKEVVESEGEIIKDEVVEDKPEETTETPTPETVEKVDEIVEKIIEKVEEEITQDSQEGGNTPANPEQGEGEEGTKNAELIQVISDLKDIVVGLCQRVNSIDDRTKSLGAIVKDAPMVYKHNVNESEIKKTKSTVELQLEKAQKEVLGKSRK